MKKSRNNGHDKDGFSRVIGETETKRVLIGQFKPKDFTYEMTIEIDADNNIATLIDVSKSNIHIGVQRMIDFMGETKVLNGIRKVLKENGLEKLDITLQL